MYLWIFINLTTSQFIKNLATNSHPFSSWNICPFIHPSIYTQWDVRQVFSRALRCLMSRRLQLLLCVHSSIARCAGSSLLPSATHQFIATKGGNTGLMLSVPHYNVQVRGVKRIFKCAKIPTAKKLHGLSGDADLTDLSCFFAFCCVPSKTCVSFCAWFHQLK